MRPRALHELMRKLHEHLRNLHKVTRNLHEVDSSGLLTPKHDEIESVVTKCRPLAGILSVVLLTAGSFALQGASASASTSRNLCRGRQP